MLHAFFFTVTACLLTVKSTLHVTTLFQVVPDRCPAAGAHRQRDQELLELHHQEAAQEQLGGLVAVRVTGAQQQARWPGSR